MLFLTLVWLPASVAADSRFPLRAEGNRLVDAQGRDFHVVGDAPWTLLVGLTLEEADEYLASRQAAGFNTILVELVERSHAGPRNRQGDAPFPEATPFSALSPEYVRHAQAVMDLALKHQFLVLMSHAYLGYRCRPDQGWCNEMLRTPDGALEVYGRQVGAAFARYPNLIWVHGGDVDATSYQAMPKVEAVYRGINAVLPGALHTAHCSRNLSAVDCYMRPWLNVNTTYSDCELTPARVTLDRSRAARMPSIYIEGRYEEEKSTPLCVRSQLWWSYLGGSVGHVFGNKRIWLFEPDWRDALDTPGTRAMSVASRLLDDLRAANDELVPVPLAESALRPDVWWSAWERAGASSASLKLAWTTLVDRPDEIPVAVSANTTVAYLPHATRFSYARKSAARCWVDPRTGAILPIAVDGEDLSSPDAQDWVFVAETAPRICAR